MRIEMMKLTPTIVLAMTLGFVASCSTYTSELEEAIDKTAQEQSVGLDGAAIKFHSVLKNESPKWLQIDTLEILVEVDVEFDNFQKGFDLDDIEILDERSGENYGSGPFVTYESEEDEIAKEKGKGPTRVTLIYVVPSSTDLVSFIYWGKNLNSRPLNVKNMK